MIDVCYADVSPLMNDTIFDAAINSLVPIRRKKAETLKVRSAKNLSVGASLMLEAALKKRGYNINNLDFGKDKNGKPYIIGKNIHFSLSHSGNIALCAIGDFNVGADVEEIGECNMNICKRFFQKKEYDAVANAKTNEERNDLFFRIWTLKESFVKMTGKGLGGFSDFEVCIDRKVNIYGLNDECFLYELEIPGYKLAVCSETPQEINLERINIIKPFV